MAIKISELTAIDVLAVADEFPVVDNSSSETKKATGQQLFNFTNTVTATGSTTARLLADRFAEVVNVKDYGAVGDGVTNDTAAFNAVTAKIRASIITLDANSYLPITVVVPPGRYSVSSWDLTNLLARQVNIHMEGAVLEARTAGKHVIDGIGSRWLRFYGGVVYSPIGVITKSGIQIGPKGTETIGNNSFHDMQVTGYYTHAAFMNLGSETTTHFSSIYHNRNTGSVYSYIGDGLSTYLPTSDYATITRSSGTGISLTQNNHYGTQFRNEGGGSSIYLANVQGWMFDQGSYFLSHNDSNVVVFSTAVYLSHDLTLNGLFESLQDGHPDPGNIGVRYLLTLDNDGSGGTAVEGLTINSAEPNAETYLIRNIGASSYRLSNVNITLYRMPAASPLFFGGSGALSVDGKIWVRSSSELNLGALTSFDGDIMVANYSSILSLPVAGAWRIIDTSSGVTYGSELQLAGKLVVRNIGNESSVLTLADDKAAYLTFSGVTGGTAMVTGNIGTAKAALVHFRVGDGSAHATIMANSGGGVVGQTGTLAGTTGTNGNLTIAADTATNRLYIENRTGGSVSYSLILSTNTAIYQSTTLV
jgi:hypothetical protein